MLQFTNINFFLVESLSTAALSDVSFYLSATKTTICLINIGCWLASGAMESIKSCKGGVTEAESGAFLFSLVQQQ